MPKDDLIPLKQVLGALGVSRPTLWRARQAVENFPEPIIVRRRRYWQPSDLPNLRDALLRYKGRVAFEVARRHAEVRAARDKLLAERKRSKRRAETPKAPGLFD